MWSRLHLSHPAELSVYVALHVLLFEFYKWARALNASPKRVVSERELAVAYFISNFLTRTVG